MYLSSLEVIGFKSFAQRVDLKFDSGVTAVVGPNGCGKTNIVDAIRWVLGEQRYSTLRSDKMEDVIFNGTKNRRALGMAEASLIIENTKGILPTEYSQITITRRVYRSGESEYLLNKVQCRLKDILDLFMDTGMGPDAYSVIELKMVETILSESAEERRRLFEEAAGVTKYKHRRKAAYRKLDEVRADLTRVNDIVKEVQKTVNQLERQARKAEQYNEVAVRLDKIEIELLEREYSSYQGKLIRLEEQYRTIKSQRDELQKTLDSQEDQVDTLRTGMESIENELGEISRTVDTNKEALHRHEESLVVGRERRNSLASNIERFEREKLELSVQREKFEQEQVQLQSRKGQVAEELETIRQKHSEALQERETTGKQLQAKKIEVQSLNDSNLELAHQIVEKRGEHERLKARVDNSKGRVDRSQEEIDLFQEGVTQRNELVTKLTHRDREFRRQFLDAEKRQFDGEASKNSLKNEIDELQKLSLELQNEVERRKEKITFLQGLFETSEGTNDGASFLLHHEHWKSKVAKVTDLFETDERYQFALEAALGDAMNWLVVDHERDALGGIEELQSAQQGKATFVCLERIPVFQRFTEEVEGQESLFRLKDVIRCDAKYRPLVNILLDGAVLVDSMEKAKEIFASHTGIQCLTADGQSISQMGIVRGGSPVEEHETLFGKKTKIVEFEKEITLYEQQLLDVIAQLEEKENLHREIDVRALSAHVKSIEKDMTAIEMQIAQVEFEKKHAQEGIVRHQQEQETLWAEIHSVEEQDETILEQLKALEEKKSQVETAVTTAQHELETVEVLFKEKSARANQLNIRVVALQNDLNNIGKDLNRLVSSLDDIRTTFSRREEEIVWARGEIHRLTTTIESQTMEVGKLQNELEAQEQQKQAIEKEYTEKRNVLHQIELRLKDERRLHDDAVSGTHELQVKITELRAQIDHLRKRAKEEFELELELKEFPDASAVDIALLKEEVKTLKERKKMLGAINFAAFDEYQSESERLTFLSQQRDDLNEAEQTLIKTIEEINTTAQQKFIDTFTKIRENFINIFKELFDPGDECDLRLEEDVDPLEANIEIVAKPRGKRPTSIDLLSGGEKTLTAISLLFAIYLVKPSPFCILDEVDAPLDDSNIDRYSRMIKKFSENTQFIVVTHNKRTMEAAQALYGVTMEEEGISKLVTVRFNQEAKVRSATVASEA